MSVKTFGGCIARLRGLEGGFGLQLFKESRFTVSSISQITDAYLVYPLQLSFASSSLP